MLAGRPWQRKAASFVLVRKLRVKEEEPVTRLHLLGLEKWLSVLPEDPYVVPRMYIVVHNHL